jgi:glycosyltransferase involved in cell wall biosynthesis
VKILHVVAGLPRFGGGLSEAVPLFAREAAAVGHSVVLATVADGADRLSEATERAQKSGVSVVRFAPVRPFFLFFSWQMFWGLREHVKRTNLVHVHSNWTFPVWWACFWALCLGKPFVMSPHGTLDPVRLAHSAWKKKLVGGVDRFFLRRAAAVHATSEIERGWIERFISYKDTKGINVVIVPNGVEMEERSGRSSKVDECGDGAKNAGTLGFQDGRNSPGERIVLYLGRNHPLKGLDLLEAAWEKVKRDGWRLDLVGSGLPGGLVEGTEKWRVLRSADVFVLPTRSENFGLVVAEALACGVPVITTKGAPWAELVSERCGWWVDVSVEALAVALKEAMDLTDEERQAMGENGKRLVERKYRWETVGVRMVEMYEKCVNAGMR